MPLIPITDIALLNRQRKTMDPIHVRALADDIERVGLLHPPVVRPPHEGEDAGGKPWVLMVGGCRLAAHALLGRAEIEVKFKSDLSPIDAKIAELSENIRRANITFHEEVDARAEIAALLREKTPGIDDTSIAQEIGISKAQLSKDLQLHKHIVADPGLRTASSKGSALRIAEFKKTLDDRIKNVRATQGDGRLTLLQEKLVTADARTFIRQVPTDSVDMIFTDLPYGLDYYGITASESANLRVSTYDDTEGTTKDLIVDLVPQMLRVVKPSGWIVLFMCYEWHAWLMDLFRDSCMVHHDYRDETRQRCLSSCGESPCIFSVPESPPWLWTRRGKGNHGHWPELHASNRYEMIVVVNGGSAKLARKPVENVLDFPPLSEERLHAMQKPHELCVELIQRCTVLDERVLDVCMGSGAHLAAAAACGRDFAGCDSNPANLASALQLVAQHWSKHTAAAIKPSKPELVP